MYRVTIYKDKRLIATFLEDLMSVAVGKAQRIGNKNDEVYIHEVIKSVKSIGITIYLLKVILKELLELLLL
jgi:hypothetical protein